MNRLLRTLALIGAIWPALICRAQNVVFNDSFTADALNPATYPTVTGTSTGWDVLTNKSSPAPTEAGGILTINMAGTSSGFAETQALFSPAPVQLLPGTYVELTATFVPTFVLTNPSDNLIVGLFNSGGSAPLSGLLNSGLSNGLTNFATGGAKGWIGYNANIPLTGSAPKMLTRPAQTGTNNTVQDVVIDSQSTSVGYSTPAGVSASSVGAMSTTLVNGSTYTLNYRLSLSADGLTLTAALSLYNGTGTTGTGANTLVGSYTGRFTGATLLTKSFDALAFGWRADAGTSSPSNLKFSALTVKTTGGAPWFTTQPPSSIAVSIGSNMTLTTAVGGTVSAYQWQVSTNGGSTFANLDPVANPSAATATLTINDVQNSDAGIYRVIASNSAGATTSSSCNVTVSATPVAPTVIINPVGATVLGGTAYTFNVTVNGTSPLSYQWSFSSDGTTYAPIAGATSASYAIPSVSLANEGYYKVAVTNVAGSDTSSAAQLVVNQPLTITAQPAGTAIALGGSATLSVTAVGKPSPTYQWYLNGTAIGGATSANLTIGSATGANAGIDPVVVAKSAGDSVTSAGAAVAVVSPTLAATARTPVSTATGLEPDTRLTLTFNQPIVVGVMGKIRIYDASNPTTPVDTIDLITATALMKTLRAASTISTQALPVQNKTVGGLTNFNYYPITVSGNTATIYPRNNVLGYGKSYFVTIDPGVFTDSSGLSYSGIPDNTGWTFSTKTVGPASGATWIVVAADGSGDFCTVQGALDFIPSGNTTPRTLFIKKGTYFEEVYFSSKHSITFLGEDRAQTVIAYPNNNNFNNVSGSYHRMTFQADKANNVVIANLTVLNSTPKGGSQAEALILNGTTTARAIVTNVTLFSYQDTLQVNGQGYVTDSHISGDVDYMWGGGPCFFNNCQLTALSSGGYHTQIRNGSTAHGYVFYNCTLDAAAGVSGMYLSRIDPNPSAFPFSEVVYLNCIMGTFNGSTYATSISPAGWLLNNTPDQTAASAPNIHFWEYNSHYSDGTPLNVASRIGASKQLTLANDAATIANYSTPSYVLGNGWTPQLPPLIAMQPTAQAIDSGSSFTLSVQAFGIPALTYQWQHDGVSIPGATNASYLVASSAGGDAGTYTVLVSNGTTTVASSAVALVVHGGPPVISLQPANTTGLLGTTATLSVWAVGDGPYSYQWSKDGTPISGATNLSLRLTGLQASDAGNYSVAVSNAGGTTASSAASLAIVSPAAPVPTLPTIPAARYDVTAYGALGDGVTDNTAAIQAAINAAKAAGGGTIEFPPASAAYLCGPITVYSSMNIQVDAGASLRALPFGTYPRSTTAPAHFITINSSSTDVEFSGGGVIDGDGAAWWAAFDAGTITARPRLVQINKSNRMLFTGLTFLNSPNFHLAFSGSNNDVTLYGVTVSAPGDAQNTDGMDIAGTNYLVQGCSVSVGDDDIVAKPGSVFCRNMLIANCTIGTGHGVSIGGQTNVGLDGMTVMNCTFNGTSSAIRMKADPTQGGPVQNVTFKDLTMTNVTYPILFYSYYNQLGSPGATSGSSQITPAKVNAWNVTPPNSLASTTIPTWRNITISNLTVNNGQGSCTIWGLPLADALIANVTLNNVTITGGAGLELYDATNIQFTGTTNLGPVITCNALAITGQPQNKTVSVGDTVTFSATAVGGSGTNNTGLTYQWRLNGIPLLNGLQLDGSTLSGVNTPTLTIANARASGAGNYTVTFATTLDGYNTSTNALVANSLPVSATSAAAVLTVNPLPASIAVSNLHFVYDGNAKTPTATTIPAGLPVAFKYNGSASAPTDAGSYVVTATIDDPNYIGSATATLVIDKATPLVSWTQPDAITYGTTLGAGQLNATAPTAGTFVYTPAAGTVLNAGANQALSVTFTPADTANFNGASAATTISVNPAPVTIVLTNLTQVYDGAPKPVTVGLNPAGIAYVLTYDSAETAPAAAGSYAVNLTILDPNYVGSASATLTIAKATPVISWHSPAAITYGTALSATQLNATASTAGTFVYTPAAGTVLNAGLNQTLVVDFTPADTANFTSAIAATTITVNKATALVTLSGLSQPYDGTVKTVTAATVPAELAVDITYGGSEDAPLFPGQYAVNAVIDDPNYTGSTMQTLTISVTALVRRAPTLNGGIDGSLQMLTGENVALNGNAWISGDLLVPGAPKLQLNGFPVIAGSYDGSGSTTPSNYYVTLNGKSVIRYLVREINPLPMPVVAPPTAPTGTRNVTLNSANDSAGDFATIRGLTLNGNAGAVAVPAGVYGQLTANGSSTLILGHAGATEPDVYHVQSLTLNGNSRVRVVGPVLLVLANGVTVGNVMGDSQHSEWLTLAVASGGVTLNGDAALYGYVIAPSGTVIVNGGAMLIGEVISDRLTINGNGVLAEPTR